MKIELESDFDFFESVTLKHDKNKEVRMVTRFSFNKNGHTIELSCGNSTSWHFPDEIEHVKINTQIKGYAPTIDLGE